MKGKVCGLWCGGELVVELNYGLGVVLFVSGGFVEKYYEELIDMMFSDVEFEVLKKGESLWVVELFGIKLIGRVYFESLFGGLIE